VVVPKHAGVLSALGMLVADVTRDYSASVLRPAEQMSLAELKARVAPLADRARRELAAEGFRPGRIVIEPLADVRYVGQSYEITLPLGADYRAEFDREHGRLYGYSNPKRAVEVVAVRVRAAGVTDKPALPLSRPKQSFRPAPSAVREGRFDGRTRKVAFYRWPALEPGATAPGPAVVTGPEATVVIPPGVNFYIDGFGNVIANSTNPGTTRTRRTSRTSRTRRTRRT
jgi:N-methylhydantoinase A/oxoprolinase/acetone carboxylase beta subunit